MPTGSIIDIYTTILGWYMYGALWDVIIGTGIIFIPFIARVLQVHLKDAENEKKSTKGFVRALEFNVYMMLGVLLFAGQPMIDLHTKNMTYTHLECKAVGSNEIAGIERQAEKLSYGATGTRIDNQAKWLDSSLNGRDVKIPLFWYLWMRLSHATTFALSFELPCNPDFRALADGLSAIEINDNELRKEVYQFQQDCYKRSLVKYSELKSSDPNFSLPPSLNNAHIETEELSWIGSQIFLQLSGFYDFYRAEEPVPAFIWEEDRDGPVLDSTYTYNAGFPMCDEWWEPDTGLTNQTGLRERLIDYVKNTNGYKENWGDTLRYWSDNYLGTSTQYQKDNFLLQSALMSEERITRNVNRAVNHDSQDTIRGWLFDRVLNGLVFAGMGAGSVKDTAKSKIYQTAAPIVQSVLIMIIVMFLPIFLAATAFAVDKLMLLAMLLFTVIFWGYLFQLAGYMDNFLLSSLIAAETNANASAEGLKLIGNNMAVAGDGGAFSNSMQVISYMTRASYVALPLIFTALMSLIGWQVSSSVGALVDKQSAVAANSGAQGVDAAKKIATRGR